MSADPIVLPIATIQPDFTAVVSDVREGVVSEDSFWLSCYKTGESSVHGKVYVALDETDRSLVRLQGGGGVQIDFDGDATYAAACPSLHAHPTRLVVPTDVYTDSSILDPRKSHKITAFDVAPDGTQFATGYYDGSVCLHSISIKTAQPAICKPHLSTITSLQFFPSSRVLLTAGTDFSLSILPADPPYASSDSPGASLAPVRILRGHTRGVTSTAIISRGRNILSGSKDGTLRLWDVAAGNEIRLHAAGGAAYIPILSLDIGERTPNCHFDDIADMPSLTDAVEVDTADKVVFCGLLNGSFEVYDLRVKQSAFRSTPDPSARFPLQSISYAPSHDLLATGASNGLISVYDTRSFSSPLTTFKRNGASIEDLRLVTLWSSSFALPRSSDCAGMDVDGDREEVGLAIATEDGLPYVAHVRPSGPSVRGELVGTDCDPVRFVRVLQEKEIWTAADDGAVRRYQMR
ncbi:uncharacterized protein FIBRA_09016 [Fibroporia radiculosa]|uniref:Uncharacterized protein n=1 Tax=Fibroporia radiculosa TaxID=599839 RepID=J4I3P0_9APHY|nr:uncharacterized protein FIBRA_09016 [Fibroporia radiculosa]CCM06722.1 predicted protein [Fibroporia radiculosa]